MKDNENLFELIKRCKELDAWLHEFNEENYNKNFKSKKEGKEECLTK